MFAISMTAGAINVSFDCSRYFWRLRFQLLCYLAEMRITDVSLTPLLALGLFTFMWRRSLPLALYHPTSTISPLFGKMVLPPVQTLHKAPLMASGKRWGLGRMSQKSYRLTLTGHSRRLGAQAS